MMQPNLLPLTRILNSETLIKYSPIEMQNTLYLKILVTSSLMSVDAMAKKGRSIKLLLTDVLVLEYAETKC